MNPSDGFSDSHAWSRRDIQETVDLVAGDKPAKRALIALTMESRRYALSQSLVSQAVNLVLVLTLYGVERWAPTVDAATLSHWLSFAIAQTLLRMGLYAMLFIGQTPLKMARSRLLRFVPLVILVVGVTFWLWTMHVFVHRELTATLMVFLVGMVAMTIPILGMWPAAPIVVAPYLAAMWPNFLYLLYARDLVGLPGVLGTGISLMCVFWGSLHLQVVQHRRLVDRSDRVDLLVAELHDANAQLRAANQDLRELRDTADRDLAERSALFTAASHDFRQRLHALKLLAHDDGPDAMARLGGQVDEIERYVSDILDFARAENNALRPRVCVIALQAVFHGLELAFEDLAQASNVEMRFRPTSVRVKSDPTLLQRMLENLLVNAMRFTRGTVLVAARRRNDGSIAIQVWDRGPGMSPEALARVFQPYYQADNQADHEGKREGVGLGLAVVSQFAVALEYSVTVRSRPDRGTVFEVAIPATHVVTHDEADI